MSAKRVFDEEAVCAAYREHGNLRAVAELFDTHYGMISRIVKRHGMTVRLRSRFRDHQEAIVRDYLAGETSVVEIGKRYGLSNDRVTEGLKELGLYDPTRYARFGNRRPLREIWYDKLGPEDGEKRYQEFLNKRRTETTMKGSGNPMYGKPCPQGAGYGWKGWYRESFFRSLRELAFMIDMDTKGIEWTSGESAKYTVPYALNGTPRTYRPDFVVGVIVYELKPKRLHDTPTVRAKAAAAQAFYANRGMEYRLTDWEIDTSAVKDAHTKGLIRFDRDYEARFLAHLRAASQGP